MPINVYCEGCGRQYRIADEQAGMQVMCPGGHVIRVPQIAASDEAAPAQLLGDDVTMARRGDGGNPYGSPLHASVGPRTSAREKVLPPAILLVLVGMLGLFASAMGVVVALIGEPPPVNPQAPQFRFQQGPFGGLPLLLAVISAVAELIIILGAVQMLRFKTWPLAVIGSVLAVVNVSNCCCLLGVPVGIWSLVVLSMPDVRAAFRTAPGW